MIPIYKSRTGSVVVGDQRRGINCCCRQSWFNPASSGTGNAQAGYDSFESDFQYMATLHKSKPDQLIYVKGRRLSSNGALRGSIQRDAGTFGPHSGGAEADAMAEQLRVPAFAKKGSR